MASVDNQSVAAVVKALVSKFGPKRRSVEWITDFSGLESSAVNQVLRWLRSRRLVKVKSGNVAFDALAADAVRAMVKARMTNYLETLESISLGEEHSESLAPLARFLFIHYHECMAVRCKWEFYRNGIPNWAVQKKSSRQPFMAAAASCKEIGADPREYVQAQFVKFDKLSDYRQEKLLPLPCHLAGPVACATLVAFRAELEEHQARRGPAPKTDFGVEEARLRGLAEFNGTIATRILLTMPTQFSKAFLKSKGVWQDVKDRYQSAGDDL